MAEGGERRRKTRSKHSFLVQFEYVERRGGMDGGQEEREREREIERDEFREGRGEK